MRDMEVAYIKSNCSDCHEEVIADRDDPLPRCVFCNELLLLKMEAKLIVADLKKGL